MAFTARSGIEFTLVREEGAPFSASLPS